MNIVWLAALQCVLIPLFVLLTDVPLFSRPWAMALVALLGNFGIASAGTLLGAVAARIHKGANLTLLLALPMVIPVVLAAAEATRLLAEGQIDRSWWDWNGLLAVFAAIFIVAGNGVDGFCSRGIDTWTRPSPIPFPRNWLPVLPAAALLAAAAAGRRSLGPHGVHHGRRPANHLHPRAGCLAQPARAAADGRRWRDVSCYDGIWRGTSGRKRPRNWAGSAAD